MKKAVIFDLDGTLVNSVPHYFKIHQKVLKESINYHLTEEYFYKYCNGQSAKEFYKRILKEDHDEPEIIKKMMLLDKKFVQEESAHHIKAFSGVKTILKELSKRNAVLALATSSAKPYVDIVLENNNLRSYFDIIITRDHIEKTKPNPEIFLKARQELGIPKKDCVVVEDAINGFKAAKRAGIDCVGLTTSLSQKQVKPLVTKVADHKSLLMTLEKL